MFDVHVQSCCHWCISWQWEMMQRFQKLNLTRWILLQLLINSQSGHCEVLKCSLWRPHVHSTGVFIFSVWPDNNPTGKHGHRGSRLQGKLNTTGLSLCVGVRRKRNSLRAEDAENVEWLVWSDFFFRRQFLSDLDYSGALLPVFTGAVRLWRFTPGIHL